MTKTHTSEIIQANIAVHTRMVDSYNSEPHFRPENQEKVRGVLAQLSDKCGRGKLLDLGCGTGFIIHLAVDLFDEIHGVDVTPAMLAKIDTSSGNVILHHVSAEVLPFSDNQFDIVSAYAFLHHLEDYTKVLREAFRVLKPGGLFYIDLEPNKFFWEEMSRLEKIGGKYSDIVTREINAVLHTDEEIQTQFGIDTDIFRKAEYTKAVLGGIDPYQFDRECNTIGFSECETSFQWFLGQGDVMHGQSFEAATTIETYLWRIEPLSRHLFKYLRFILTK